MRGLGSGPGTCRRYRPATGGLRSAERTDGLQRPKGGTPERRAGAEAPTPSRAALSSTELADGGRGGPARGRRWRWARPDRDRARPRPATARANSNQLTAPWLVTWRMPGPAVDGQAAQHATARSAVKVGWPRWSSTKRQRSGARPARRRMVFTMLAPCSPHTHDVRTIVAPIPRPTPRARRRASTRPYTLTRVGRVPLVVRLGLRAVEHVVGRQVHEVGAGPAAALGDPAHGRGR